MSRFQSYVDLFIQRCKEVVDGTFTTKGMFESTDFSFQGRICKFDREQILRTNIEGKL